MPRRRLAALLLAGLLALTHAAAAVGQPAKGAPPAVVAGTVVGSDEAPLAFANVMLAGTVAGAATAADGRFAFAVQATGTQTVRASMIGYAPATARVTLAPGDTARVRLTLRPRRVELGETVVTAEAAASPTGVPEGADTMTPLEAVTTPGASGDVFRALQALPGLARVGDGAGLFVRGGAPSETVTLLDGAVVAHPYAYEAPTSGSATGGTFGAVPSFLVRGTHLATGGFSARYGNALSGVLAMQTAGPPADAAQTASLGLAAASLALDVPLAGDALGLRVAGNRAFTGLLFRVNGQADDFATVPQSTDGSASLAWTLGAGHRLKLFTFGAHHRMAVETADGVFATTTARWLHHLRHTATAGRLRVATTASLRRYAADQALGALDLRPSDDALALRTDATFAAAARVEVRAGAEGHRRTSRFEGTVPTAPGVFGAGAPVTTLGARTTATRLGGYLEADVRLAARLTARAGLRADHHTGARQTVADPRLALRMQLSDATRLRLAWGVYHQFAGPATYDPDQGNPAARAERAQHLVAGLRHTRGDWTLRAEAYLKPYDRLLVEDATGTPVNAGDGTARGLDLLARYGAFLQTRVNGWVSYSLLDARRTQRRALGPTSVLERGPAPFDVTHTLNAVGKVHVGGGVFLGGRLTVASGRPVTPITGGVPQAGGAYVLPVEGAVGSERLPAFRRLDLQAAVRRPFGDGRAVTVYVALANALDRANVVGYTYAPDFTSRTPDTSAWRRSAYAGVTLAL